MYVHTKQVKMTLVNFTKTPVCINRRMRPVFVPYLSIQPLSPSSSFSADVKVHKPWNCNVVHTRSMMWEVVYPAHRRCQVQGGTLQWSLRFTLCVLTLSYLQTIHRGDLSAEEPAMQAQIERERVCPSMSHEVCWHCYILDCHVEKSGGKRGMSMNFEM